MSKLSNDEKVEIVFSKESTAVLAKKYNLCRTSPADIKNEAKNFIKAHYEKQKLGRPSKIINESEIKIKELEKANELLKAEIKLKEEVALLEKKLAKEKSELKKNHDNFCLRTT
jgi:adenylate cyclase class IV